MPNVEPLQSASSTTVCSSRVAVMLPVAVNLPLEGLYNSVLLMLTRAR